MTGGKKLINDPNDLVTEIIDGIVETYPSLQRLDGFPEVKVVLRADVARGSYDKVALISGGGSGHEPAHAGYVGEGMLTAAVCGDVFASPSSTAVLAAIRAVTGPPGCLLILKNYTGDRLNFGLAAEQAKSEGFKVEMVVVGDDCALPPRSGPVGRRGLAGTVLVHKVAGAAAAAGLSLAEVTAEAQAMANAVGTMGVALTVCTLPGASTQADRLGPGKMELGLGIHGEPGAEVADIQPVDVVVERMLQRILSQETQYLPLQRGDRVALMVNSLGATPLSELMVAASKAVGMLQLEYGYAVERIYTGAFMTSLDMAGMSLTVGRVNTSTLSRLDAPTKAPAWPPAVSSSRPPTKVPVPMPPAPSEDDTAAVRRPDELTPGGCLLERAITAGAQAVVELEAALNEWDTKVGDGDCGSSMRKGAAAVLEDLASRYPLNNAAATVRELGATVQRAMGGTSGVLYDVFCRAAYGQLKASSGREPSAAQWSSALGAAVQAISKYGGAEAGHRTMLDALVPAADTLQQRLAAGEDPRAAFSAAAKAAEEGAESTKGMLAVAGRSSYIPSEVLKSVPDPGAMAAACWLQAVARALS